MNHSRSVAILAGGFPTASSRAGARTPSSLVDVAGRPFLMHQVELLREQGLTDITLVSDGFDEDVRHLLGDGTRWGVRLQHVAGGPGVSPAAALRRGLPTLSDPFFVLDADTYLACDYNAVEDVFSRTGTAALLTVCRTAQRVERTGVLLIEGRVAYYDRRGLILERFRVDAGLSMFRKSIFAQLGEHQPPDLATIYEGLVANNALAGFEVPGRVYEVGSAAGLAEVRAHFGRNVGPVQ